MRSLAIHGSCVCHYIGPPRVRQTSDDLIDNGRFISDQ